MSNEQGKYLHASLGMLRIVCMYLIFFISLHICDNDIKMWL
jgi:hypothetical protein